MEDNVDIKPQDRIRKLLERRGESDLCFSPSFLEKIKSCERCSAPFDIVEVVVRGKVENSCICKYCGDSIIKGVYFYFPEASEGDDLEYMSVAGSLERLIKREGGR
jgi:hypothetical protein